MGNTYVEKHKIFLHYTDFFLSVKSQEADILFLSTLKSKSSTSLTCWKTQGNRNEKAPIERTGWLPFITHSLWCIRSVCGLTCCNLCCVGSSSSINFLYQHSRMNFASAPFTASWSYKHDKNLKTWNLMEDFKKKETFASEGTKIKC